MKYPIVIHKDQDTDYGVTIPDLPGCFSAGTSFEDALEQAKEAAECHLEGMLIDGESIPTAKSMNVHQASLAYDQGTWAFIEIDLSSLSGKSKRVNVSFPERLLVQIDKFAASHGESRSGLLAQASFEYISKHK